MYWCKPSWLWFCLVILKIITSVSQDITFDNEYPEDATIAETKKAIFKCFLIKEHEPTDQVSWIKHNIKLNQSSQSSKYYFGEKRITDRIYEYSLTIDPVERSDATDYRCVFETSIHTISSKKAYLNVLKIPSEEYPMCYFSEQSYEISDDVQIICISENTSTKISLEFTRMIELALSYENATDMWTLLKFPASPSMNNTEFACKLYIDIIGARRYCYTDPLLILNKLNIVIHGDIQYFSNQMACFICKGNYTDTAKFTWTSDNDYVNTNQVNSNNANKLTIPSMQPEMNGASLTCTVEDEGFTGLNTVNVTVEEKHITTNETTRKPLTIPPIYTVPPEVDTVIQEYFEIILHLVIIILILIISIVSLGLVGFIIEKYV
ncbi:uncharacterized protein [Antedon mediterranea]|uniref:uncharacterized protein n=1 Tax=Antedon mediterranea TaxID=105859 RepID=UPI003AF8DA46